VDEPRDALRDTTDRSPGDRRPDLKQVVVQLITSQWSLLPIWLEVLSGNSSDKESFAPSVEGYCKQLGASEQPYFGIDSAGYAADNLKTLEKMRWLMRVPETLGEAKRLVSESEKTEMLSLADHGFDDDYGTDTTDLCTGGTPTAPELGEKRRKDTGPKGQTHSNANHSLGVSDLRGDRCPIYLGQRSANDLPSAQLAPCSPADHSNVRLSSP
jgi:hypothetical protein